MTEENKKTESQPREAIRDLSDQGHRLIDEALRRDAIKKLQQRFAKRSK